MHKPIALLLGTLLPLLGLSGIGQAQPAVQVQGVIQSVDCQNGAVVLTDTGSGISNTVVARPSTAVLVGSNSVAFCTLEQYVGAPASAWLVANGNEFVVTRIDVLGPAVAAPQPPVVVQQPYPVPEPAPEIVSPLPIVGIVLGTIFVSRLTYLLTRDHDRYYRYPYYGAYYRHYYRPYYRPYLGPVPGLAPIITVPPVIAGPVLGTSVVGGFEYLVARDRDGRYYRYPYYGPYRQHYYRADYRPYYGPYRDAPVRAGDPHWGGPAPRNLSLPGPSRYLDPGRAPAWQGPRPWNADPRSNQPGPQNAPPRWTPPAFQNAPVPQNNWRPQWAGDPRNNAPGPQNAPPRWTPPAFQNAPVPQNNWRPQWTGDPRNNAPGPQNAPPRWTPPAFQNAPVPQNNWRPQWNADPRNNAPGPQNAPPRWTPPAFQNAPAPQNRAPGWQGPRQWNGDPRNNAPGPQNQSPRWTPPAYQNGAVQNDRRAPAYSPRHQQSCVGGSCDGPDKR